MVDKRNYKPRRWHRFKLNGQLNEINLGRRGEWVSKRRLIEKLAPSL
jgi:hypothetical protein